jgi:hypothetical protein
MRGLIFSTTFVWNIPYSKKHSSRYYNTCTWYMFLSSYFNGNLFFDLFSKDKYQISWRSFQGEPGAEFFHADRRKNGQTYIAKMIVVFRNFANVPKQMDAFLFISVNIKQITTCLGF